MDVFAFQNFVNNKTGKSCNGKLILLDRDGVINFDSPDFIKSPEEWQPIPGSLKAIANLNKAGWTVAVVTNQSGLARGLFSLKQLSAMHHKMYRLLDKIGGCIDHLSFCPHHAKDHCSCRKPEPGMLIDISKRYQTSLSEVPFVGDSMKDLQAAVAAKAQPILVLTGKGTDTLQQLPENHAIAVFQDLAEYSRYLINSAL